MTHEGYSTPLAPSNASDDAITRDASLYLIGSGGGKWTLRKKRNGVQAIEIQRCLSPNQNPDLPHRQRLIFNCHGELSVKEGFDKVLADDGIPLDSQHVPGAALGMIDARPSRVSFPSTTRITSNVFVARLTTAA